MITVSRPVDISNYAHMILMTGIRHQTCESTHCAAQKKGPGPSFCLPCRSQEEFFKFLLCLEEMVFDHADDKVLKTCSSHAMLSEESIRQCMDGGHGTPSHLHSCYGT